MLGLPDQIRACLFDMDGVLTNTAATHDAAWKEMFDQFLASYNGPGAGDLDRRPFDVHDDYDEYVDGKPRLDGVRDFLASRHIRLPEGSPDDSSTALTVHGLGAKKNELVLRRIHEEGVEAYPGSVSYVRAVRARGLRRAVVSSSANCKDVLHAAGILELFDAIVDGHQAEREHLAGKPAPDTYL
ncbi:MAG TPA: HAD family hydrolase, partial [Acidimicrobiales bacterium]|nr:HAD family hydrolase [Acidimicrobiales bacterium]